ncbi:MAG: hypothetical protein AABX26_01870 [Nanoarchaeota archaeon]
MGKHEKKKRKKRLKKQILGLQRQQEVHRIKLETGKFKKDFQKDTTQEYWKREIKNLEKVEEKKTYLLKKLEKKKQI